MTQDSKPSPNANHEATAAPTAPPPGHRPRAVQSGDVPPSMQPAALETHLTDRALERASTVRSMVVADALRDSNAREPAVLDEVEAMLDGASPDDVRALRRMLTQRWPSPATARATRRHRARRRLARGRVSVQEPAVAAQLRAPEVPSCRSNC